MVPAAERRPDWQGGEEESERSEELARVEPEDPSWKRDWKQAEDQLDGERQFSGEELKQLETLPPVRRVIALAVAGLWQAVLPDRWKRWVEEARIDPPFPPRECCAANGFRANVRLVAQSLEQTEDAVRQHLYRAKNVLRSLLDDHNQL